MKQATALLAGLLGASLSGPLYARAAQCDTLIDGAPVTIFFDSADPDRPGLRERWFGRPSDCPGSVVITYLTPDLTAAERQVFCANYDPATGSHSQPAIGRRDRFGRCMEPSKTCALVNATRAEAVALMGLGESVADTDQTQPPRLAQRLSSAVSAVTHSSGALILSGNASTLTGLLGSAGTALGAALSAPAVLAGAAASVVVIGGVVYLCSE